MNADVASRNPQRQWEENKRGCSVRLFRNSLEEGAIWHIASMQELSSQRGLGAHAQWESCRLHWHVAMRHLCEHLDSATGNASDITITHSTPNYATLGKHTSPLGCDVMQQWSLCCFLSGLREAYVRVFNAPSIK
jgi:hypothetical protein